MTAGRGRGTVHGTGGGLYRIKLDTGEVVDAAFRGRLKQEQRTGDRVVVGDRVEASRQGDGWVVESVEERRSELVRSGPGGRRAKVVAANLDRALVVVAAREPDPTPSLVDRLLFVVEASGVEPVLVVNKVDLPGAPEVAADLERLYGGIGYRVLCLSASSGEGVEALAEVLSVGTSALVGPSGAGKSSLLNALHPELALTVGDLSERTRRGRHTTVSSRLIPLAGGGVVADTPGFGDVGLWGVDPAQVAGCFPEIRGIGEGCRFRGCAHLKEPDCAVRAAVDSGRVAASRYRSYVTLREEAED